MLKPLNRHVLIEPVEHKDFIPSERTTYDEVGVVVDLADDLAEDRPAGENAKEVLFPIHAGDRVFFDSWMVSKFPKEGSRDEFYWLVPYDNIKGVEVSG